MKGQQGEGSKKWHDKDEEKGRLSAFHQVQQTEEIGVVLLPPGEALHLVWDDFVSLAGGGGGGRFFQFNRVCQRN